MGLKRVPKRIGFRQYPYISDYIRSSEEGGEKLHFQLIHVIVKLDHFLLCNRKYSLTYKKCDIWMYYWIFGYLFGVKCQHFKQSRYRHIHNSQNMNTKSNADNIICICLHFHHPFRNLKCFSSLAITNITPNESATWSQPGISSDTIH